MTADEMFADNPAGVAEALSRATVGIAGAGGIGSNVAVLLARAGTGRLVVADFDVVEAGNLNRQFYFLDQTGMPKVQALGQTLARINPRIRYEGFVARLDRQTCCDFFPDADVLVEAFDQAESKQFLLEEWLTRFPGRPVVAASGLAGAGGTDRLHVFRSGTLTVCGDFESGLERGTVSARVGIVASMMANEIISILVDGFHRAQEGS